MGVITVCCGGGDMEFNAISRALHMFYFTLTSS
jgi:hypothetical protein